MKHLKINLSVLILSNLIFFVWINSGKYLGGDIGMIPFLFISVSLFAFFAVLILNLCIKLPMKSVYYFVFIFQQIALPVWNLISDKYYDISDMPLLNLVDSDLNGFISRGMVVACIIAIFLQSIYEWKFNSHS